MNYNHKVFWPGVLVPMVWLLACLSLILPGCVTAPVNAAQTPEQKAYAVYGTFVVLEERAAALASLPTVPATVKKALKEADALAKPSADALALATEHYTAVSNLLKTGLATPEQVAAALTTLTSWAAQTQADMQTLTALVQQNTP